MRAGWVALGTWLSVWAVPAQAQEQDKTEVERPVDEAAGAVPGGAEVASTPEDEACPEGPPDALDSDGDGIPDELELATGTSPFDADSDGDGVPDGVEDANQDGVRDPGESDPRRPGLFPGSNPHIPEPLYFDLVRGLGARKGELEVNVLMDLSSPRGGRPELAWAPEVEWAIVDGFAVELELPMLDRLVKAYKAALQWTIPSFAPNTAHGVQLLGEYLIDERVTELAPIYLIGGRVGRTSLFAMVGPRFDLGAHTEVWGLLNPSVFVDADEALTFGIEGNLAFAARLPLYAQGIAQLHWQVSKVFRLQVGGGVRGERRATPYPVGVMRLILE